MLEFAIRHPVLPPRDRERQIRRELLHALVPGVEYIDIAIPIEPDRPEIGKLELPVTLTGFAECAYEFPVGVELVQLVGRHVRHPDRPIGANRDV